MVTIEINENTKAGKLVLELIDLLSKEKGIKVLGSAKDQEHNGNIKGQGDSVEEVSELYEPRTSEKLKPTSPQLKKAMFRTSSKGIAQSLEKD